MAGIASNGLHHLSEKRPRVGVELAPEYRQAFLQLLEVAEGNADAVTGHLDDGAMHGLVVAHDRPDIDQTLAPGGGRFSRLCRLLSGATLAMIAVSGK